MAVMQGAHPRYCSLYQRHLSKERLRRPLSGLRVSIPDIDTRYRSQVSIPGIDPGYRFRLSITGIDSAPMLVCCYAYRSYTIVLNVSPSLLIKDISRGKREEHG